MLDVAGLLVYVCLGLPDAEGDKDTARRHTTPATAVFPRSSAPGTATLTSTSCSQAPKGGSQYFRMIHAPHTSALASHSMSLAVEPWGFAVGSGTGDISVYDFSQGGRLANVAWSKL
jgi:hypothetical protein